MSTAFEIKNPVTRKNSLQCSCESINLSLHKKCSAKCDFCSEKQFIKSLKVQSTPTLSIFDMDN